uniref:Uncharacterized protein n=1 Tax=Rhizophora mucronata TaxID=61149 RepID=A0A2P2NRQ7_RHIMU
MLNAFGATVINAFIRINAWLKWVKVCCFDLWTLL